MLRTHHMVSAEYLSIYEQLSSRAAPAPAPAGVEQQAYHIFPGFAFSMRDANQTTILGIRVVYTTNATARQTCYWLTDLDGNERLMRAVTQPIQATQPPKSLGRATIRGIDVMGWEVDASDGNSSTVTYYVQETRDGNDHGGQMVWYPFRFLFTDPPGGPEVGYLLDHGSHYPVAIDEWFDTTGCEAPKHDPTPVVAGLQGHDHWHVLRSLV